ncbi:hypothetical protein [Panacibacter ginsenosidivorans]|uniref:hypothetical protein n=1 Tax=Panacibacter ginsenosidivorans TaxID=1813871 RepID=UPI001CEF6F0F|nr:hypothetical protein [Panacibacter ginsenosidivorans]
MAPLTGSPVSASVSLPEMVVVCAMRAWQAKSKGNSMAVLQFLWFIAVNGI